MIDACADGLLVVALMGELGIVFANVLARVFFNTSFLWADEVARFVLSIIAFIGGAVAYRRREHAFVRVLLNRCPAGMQRVCFALGDVLALFISLVAGYASFEFIRIELGRTHPDLPDPGGHDRHPADRGLGADRHLCGQPPAPRARTASLGGGRSFIVVMAGVMAARSIWLAWFAGDNCVSLPPSLSSFVAILVGVPVGFVLLIATAELSVGDRCPLAGVTPAEHGERDRELHSPGGAVLHLHRTDHGAGRH